MAANVATADTGAVSRIISGWPAIALLIAVKLLSGILEHRPAVPVPDPAADTGRDCPGDQARRLARQPVPVPLTPAGTVQKASHRDSGRPPAGDGTVSRPAPGNTAGRQASSPDGTAAVPAAQPAPPDYLGTARAAWVGTRPGTVPGTAAGMAALLPAARAVQDELHRDGCPLTRDALAARMRQADHPVRNARLTPLLQALRSESAGLSPLNGH